MSENEYWDIRNKLTDLVCTICAGSGKCDDAWPGDVSFSEWQCQTCDAVGNPQITSFTPYMANAIRALKT